MIACQVEDHLMASLLAMCLGVVMGTENRWISPDSRSPKVVNYEEVD